MHGHMHKRASVLIVIPLTLTLGLIYLLYGGHESKDVL